MSSAPAARSMNTGSRPIARIARTGELTPPGRTRTARAYSAADRVSVSEVVTPRCSAWALPSGRPLSSPARSSSVRPLPLPERVREVEHPDLLELRRGVEGGPLLDARRLGDRVEDRVALLLGAPVGHGEHGVGPVGVGRALVAVRDAAER